MPAELYPLAELARDVFWTWNHTGDALWQTINPEIWAQTANPYVILQNLSPGRMRELAQDTAFRAELARLARSRQEYLSSPCWYETMTSVRASPVAYFSMEFGLSEALPFYAGGLGILAGDHLKASSDLGVPLVGVGLLYQEGYFRQTLDAGGRQQEIYPYNDTTGLPIVPAEVGTDGWLHVAIEFPGRIVRFRVWQVRVGRVMLYLLDSNDPLNNPRDRGITSRLYGGGQELRLVQEIALGIGGWRTLEALGLEVEVCHLNEGHAAFVTLERARAYMQSHHVDFWEGLWATRAGNVFTTHTPVPSGFDRYDSALLARYGGDYSTRFGISAAELLGLGRKNPADAGEPFNMAYLAARTCGAINGVSRLHGDVSRHIFQGLYPRWPQREVPVRHVTNGVHVPTWDSSWADRIWTDACGKDRWLGGLEDLGPAIEALDDKTLWTFRGQQRSDLVRYARERVARQLGQRGADAQAVAEARDILDPNALTIGFARRFAEYKRPNLLLHDARHLARLLTNHDMPVQIIVAGKAHPLDEKGKQFVREWAEFVKRPEVRAHAVFLEDYDMTLAQELVQGVDLWINTPRRPWEACGTSGMKVLVNGGVNLSELDGWWAEAYSPDVGWSLGDGREHAESGWDMNEATELYRLLEQEVLPAFYGRGADGIPHRWVARMRASMARLAPRFSSNRMVQEYVQEIYLPAAAEFRERVADSGKGAHELRVWELELVRHWHGIHLGNLEAWQEPDGWSFTLAVYLGEIPLEGVEVQLYADPVDAQPPVQEAMKRQVVIPGAANGYVYHCRIASHRPVTHFTPRVVPYHPRARVPIENNLVLWGLSAVSLHLPPGGA
ncbi:MAG: alpha-glucan family phosphorylase [Acidiferrobacterales bacterium]